MRAITFYRRRLGLTQQDLADLVGVYQPKISDIETGRTNPSERLLERLAQALGVEPAITLLRPITTVVFEGTTERLS